MREESVYSGLVVVWFRLWFGLVFGFGFVVVKVWLCLGCGFDCY